MQNNCYCVRPIIMNVILQIIVQMMLLKLNNFLKKYDKHILLHLNCVATLQPLGGGRGEDGRRRRERGVGRRSIDGSEDVIPDREYRVILLLGMGAVACRNFG